MSVAATTAVWENSRAEGVALTVLLALADHADPVGVAWPSVARLAAMCRVSDRTIQTHVKHLEKIGELKREMNQGRRGCNLYQILLPMNENSKKKGVHEPPKKASPPKILHPEDFGNSGVKHASHTPEDLRSIPPKTASPEPSGTTKNREGEPARARETPPLSDFEFCEEALRELFPNAIWPLPKNEKSLVEDWVPAMAELEPDDFDALVVWFREATDEARGSERKPKPVWPRDRGEFLRNFPEVIEKVRAWWAEKGAKWWEKRQRVIRRREERERAESGSEEEGETMSRAEALAFLREGMEVVR